MKKIIILATLVVVATVHVANAACTANTKSYSSCKPGYYKDSTSCKRCPALSGTYGTTVDKNTGDITSCYIPAGTSLTDTRGTYKFTENCNYSTKSDLVVKPGVEPGITPINP